MSRSGNRVTPASGRATGQPREQAAAEPGATRSGVLPALRWWPRARPRPAPGAPDGDDRWGVARLVAQREAERRMAEAGPDPVDGATEHEVVEVAAVEDAAADRHVDEVAIGDVTTGDTATDSTTVDEASAEPGDVPTPPAPRRPEPAVPPSPRPPLRRPPPVPRPPLPMPRRPHGAPAQWPVVPNASDSRMPRPRVEPDLSLFGFARHTRGRLGARVFTAFFVLVFAFILVQTIASIV